MGAISDVTSEFKQAGPKEKTMIVIAIIGVAGVAYYLYSQRQASATQQGVLAARSGTETPQPTGYPETSGGVPTIPGGVSPLYDPAGNLIAFQNPGGGGMPSPTPSPSPSPSPTPSPGPHPSPSPSFLIPHLAIWRTNSNGTYSWRLPNTSSWQPISVPTGTKVYQGSEGRIWYLLPGQPKSAQQILNPSTGGT